MISRDVLAINVPKVVDHIDPVGRSEGREDLRHLVAASVYQGHGQRLPNLSHECQG